MEGKKHWVSLSVKLNTVIMILIIILASGMAGIAYYINGERVDRFFKDNTAEEALAISRFMDGDFVEELLTAIKTDEFTKMREQAEAAGDESAVTDWLRAKGLYDSFSKLNESLATYRDSLDAQSIYIQSVEGNRGINLVDPSEDMLYVGSVEISADEFGAYQTNERIEPTVSTTEFGWLCSAYEPVYTSDGRAVALLGIDIDMNDVMHERQQFLRMMLFFALMLMIVSVTLSVMLMRKMATRPLSMLSKAVDGFADEKDGYTKNDIISLPIDSQDEIGDLYKEIRGMQGRMVEYLDNLTRVTAEKERIGAELNVATEIQADMLPSVFPPFPDRDEFDLYATMNPAKEVGGDFYDFFLIDDDHLALVIADVSGKGVPAALVMVITKTLIKNRAMMGGTPAEILSSVNEQLYEGNEACLFVTVWMAIIEISTGKGVVSNAGHEHPVIRRGDGKYELVVYRHSPAVAVMEGLRFKEHTFEMKAGDRLFVYTDGVPEATNSHDELFGTDRMLDVLNRNPDLGPEELLPALKKEIDEFVGEAPQFDDITMLCLKYNGGHEKMLHEMTIEAKVENLPSVLQFIDGYLEEYGCDMKTQMQLDVAIEELFVNVASYAYRGKPGTAVVQIGELKDPEHGVMIVLKDHGIPYNPLAKEDPDVTLSAEERDIGGLGIFMAKKAMDEMRYAFKDRMNVLEMVKYL